jgi:hypothetical protein
MRRSVVALSNAGLVIALGALAGCSSTEVLVAHSVKLETPAQQVPEDELIDVGVNVFKSGVPEGEIDKELLEELIRDGTFVQIRRAEALYMAVLLRDTLQRSGQWGSVWVTPKETTAADLAVTAEILHSDGDVLQLGVRAVDATGSVWLDEKYEMATAAGAFNRQRYPELDPYQDVFNSIANDLAAARGQLSAGDVEELRTVAALRYAQELSPEAFDGYVVQDGDDQYALNRLPASGDPMFDRTQRVRQREHLFFETLDQHYAKFYDDAGTPYNSWREYAREEAISIKELQRSARWRTGMGVATILASIVYGSNSNNDSFSDRVIRDAMMYVGMDMLRTSAVRRQEKRLHTDTLEELSSSFDDEVEPLVVEIQGTQHRLTGTADVQYQEWRDLLRQMFITETGFVPEDLSVYAEPEPTLPELPALPEGQVAAGALVGDVGALPGDGAPADASAPPADAEPTDGSVVVEPTEGSVAEPAPEAAPAADEAESEGATADGSSSLRAGA